MNGSNSSKAISLGRSALVEFQFRADDNHGTAGIVDPFTEQVLTEAALLSFQHFGQRFQRAVACAHDRMAMAAIIKQGIDSFLQHPLFVADDHFRRFKLEDCLQTVVAVDDAAVEVVEVGCGKASAIERNERAQIRRDDRDCRPSPSSRACCCEETKLSMIFRRLASFIRACIDFVLRSFSFRSTRTACRSSVANRSRIASAAHFGNKGIASPFFLGFAVFDIVEELFFLQFCVAWIDHHIFFVIDDPFEICGGHSQHVADAGGHRLEEPDVDDRNSQLDMGHALAAHFGQGDFHAAAVADDPFVLNFLIFSAGTFPIARRTENLLAEQVPLFQV